MRGIFWWNRKMDSSWSTMEKDTSPFFDRKKKRSGKGKKPEKEYPELHRTVKTHDERFDAPSSEIVGVIILVICLMFATLPFIILVRESPVLAAFFGSLGGAGAIWFGVKWRRMRKTRWNKEDDKPQDSSG